MIEFVKRKVKNHPRVAIVIGLAVVIVMLVTGVDAPVDSYLND